MDRCRISIKKVFKNTAAPVSQSSNTVRLKNFFTKEDQQQVPLLLVQLSFYIVLLRICLPLTNFYIELHRKAQDNYKLRLFYKIVKYFVTDSYFIFPVVRVIINSNKLYY